jgi:hypothetical protein
MKTKLVYLFISISVILSACKGDDGPEGPQGPAGTPGPAFSFAQGGFIEGTITGTRQDGTPFTLDFNYKYYFDADNYWYDQFGPIYDFEMYRYAASNPQVPGTCYLTFELYPLTSTMPSYVAFDGDFYQDLGNNQTFVFALFGISGPSIIVTNFSYNTTSHIAQGDFAINLSGSDNTTGNPATISGSFQSAAFTEYVYRRGN